MPIQLGSKLCEIFSAFYDYITANARFYLLCKTVQFLTIAPIQKKNYVVGTNRCGRLHPTNMYWNKWQKTESKESYGTGSCVNLHCFFSCFLRTCEFFPNGTATKVDRVSLSFFRRSASECVSKVTQIGRVYVRDKIKKSRSSSLISSTVFT